VHVQLEVVASIPIILSLRKAMATNQLSAMNTVSPPPSTLSSSANGAGGPVSPSGAGLGGKLRRSSSASTESNVLFSVATNILAFLQVLAMVYACRMWQLSHFDTPSCSVSSHFTVH
jgi:hypothetical protein